MSRESDFYIRRLHSLLGIIPVGLFVAQHLVINHFATRGPEAFNAASDFMGNLPFVLFLEWFIIYIPLMLHAFYGLYIAFTAKNNVTTLWNIPQLDVYVPTYNGCIFSCVYRMAYLRKHVLQKAFGADVNFDMMADILSSPFMLVFYMAGVIAATFHLANGLWSFLVTWGISQSPRSQKIVTYVSLGVFLVLSVIGVQALLAFV